MVPIAALYILAGGWTAAYGEYFGLPHYGYYAVVGLTLGAISVAYMVVNYLALKKRSTTDA